MTDTNPEQRAQAVVAAALACPETARARPVERFGSLGRASDALSAQDHGVEGAAVPDTPTPERAGR